jgi:hypothetical protein
MARALDIPNRDHMLAVGDKVFKAAALEFFDEVEAGSDFMKDMKKQMDFQGVSDNRLIWRCP